MPHRIEITTKVNDTRSEIMCKKLASLNDKIASAKVVDVYTINKKFTSDELKKIAQTLSNPISQNYKIFPISNNKQNLQNSFDFALEIGFLPGVTDNEGHTAQETIQDLIQAKFSPEESVHSSKLIFLSGKGLSEDEIQEIGWNLANKLIQRIHIKSQEKYFHEQGMDIFVPKVELEPHPQADEVDLDIPEEQLLKLGKQGIPNEDGTRRGPLALEKDYLYTIKDYFEKENRKPRDIELESLAQTWSEHCKHTIFAAKIDDNEQGLYKGFIKKATHEIRKRKGKNDFCVSVFKDNSGGIIFDENFVITDKAETHNSPSALDPFGGAITGIVGVNRDTLGFGLAAKPIINKYGYCVGYPNDKKPLYRDKNRSDKALAPKRIFQGIIDGVRVGGNCSGIPTPQGFVYFDHGYKGKPLVFVGTIGLIPRTLHNKPSWEKSAQPHDNIIMVGGKVGQDGIHGATFSSEALSHGSPATAVQIGDPITQKKLSDAIVKEARDLDLYNSITDCGAGGISCAISEMAKECGGCEVDLEKVPLKYPNLEPWKIWISESQERMVLAIPDEKLDEFIKLMEKRGVQATNIGKFTDADRCVVRFQDKTIMDLDMDFLHDGLPRKKLKTTYTRPKNPEPKTAPQENLTQTLLEMLSRPNLCSYDFISYQYDHMVQAGAVLGPLHGKGKVNSPASVTKPVLNSNKGVVCSQGINAKYSRIDTYHMAACAIDTAIRNNLATGGNLEHMALMDNFCWCSSNEQERLGQLKAAAQACYDYATAYNTPFISGKDSMFNDFKGFDKNGEPIKISVPPTLLISSLSVISDVTKTVSLDPKFANDLIYIIGETAPELGASEYFEYLAEKSGNEHEIGNSVPQVTIQKALKIYKAYQKAISQRLISSGLSPANGGIAATLAKKAISGSLGMQIDLSKLPITENLDREDFSLFSESQSRFIVTIDPNVKTEFEALFEGLPIAEIGKVTENPNFTILGFNAQEIINTNLNTLDEYYRKTFKNY
jgi:phosphoribosylformylglycinamidine synthase